MKKQQGGKRAGAGRKPVPDKKIQIPLYIPGSWIKAIGLDECKDACYKAIGRRMAALEKK